jgi:hypothetical protein
MMTKRVASIGSVLAVQWVLIVPACSEDLVLGPGKSTPTGGAAGDGARGESGQGGQIGQAGDGWTGNPPGCPTDAPMLFEEDQPCALPEGRICTFVGPMTSSTGESSYAECACLPAGGGERLWWCYRRETQRLCPEREPAPGTTCADRVGASCPYPDWKRCTCPTDPAAPIWACEVVETPGYSPPALPSSLDETKKITELDDAERTTFCEWLADAFSDDGSGDAPDEWPLTDGYSTQGLFAGGSFPCHVCAGPLPISYCAANLELSTCEASMDELSDCVKTMARQCLPSPLGCAKYAEQPGCLGTIVGASEPSTSECRLRVE